MKPVSSPPRKKAATGRLVWTPPPSPTTITFLPSDRRALLSGLPFPPCIERHGNYDLFTFSMQMLESVNKRFDQGGHHVNEFYRQRELQEVERIVAQRDAVEWRAEESDLYAIHYVFSYGSTRKDLHNPLKPTCDLLGKGRYEWVEGARLFIPHAQVIWDDNRVWDEKLTRIVSPKATVHWAIITVVRYHQRCATLLPIHRILHGLMTRYDPRVIAWEQAHPSSA